MKLLALLIGALCVVQISAVMYGERLREIEAFGPALTWKPRINGIFENTDESVIRGFLGSFFDTSSQDTTSIRRPTRQQLGRGPFANVRGRVVIVRRYQPGNQQGYPWQRQNNGQNGQRNANNNQYHDSNLPESFDWRDHSSCQSLRDIRHQKCGDCWAVATASVISDRYCIYTGENRIFSARQLTSCVYPNQGCNGGLPKQAMDYYATTGLASGGDPTLNDERQGCLPYPRKMTNQYNCAATCDDGSPMDLKKAGGHYRITSQDVNEIMHEIYNYGPVVAVMQVYGDFPYYSEGVYKHVTGAYHGGHAVKIMGWGTENNQPYWLVANSWGHTWGDSGYFKILRGSNHCGIESAINCATPAEAY